MIDIIRNIHAFLIYSYAPTIGVYLLGGVIYATAKWVFLLYKLRTKVLAIDATLIEKFRGSLSIYKERPDEEIINKIRQNYACSIFGTRHYPPLITENKGNFLFCAIFWPINLVWTLVADVSEQFFTWIFHKCSSFLQELSNKIVPK